MSIALDDSRLLDTWDRASALARPWRELALLDSATELSVDELARLSIGERDRLLLALRIGTFGNRLDCETRCPSCDARLELSFDASELLVPPRVVEPDDLEIRVDDWTVRFRLPDSFDVAASLDGDGDALAKRVILSAAKHALRSASDVGDPSAPGHPERSEGSLSRDESDPSSLPLLRMTETPLLRMTSIRERVAERMAALDPQADISLDLSCAACAHRWQSPFDPAAFLFREVDAHVDRLTSEVHRLARAYAWSEESILAMGAARRRRYLSLLAQ